MRGGPAGLRAPPSVLLMNTHIASSLQDETERSFVSCAWPPCPSDEPGMLIGLRPNRQALPGCKPSRALLSSPEHKTARSHQGRVRWAPAAALALGNGQPSPPQGAGRGVCVCGGNPGLERSQEEIGVAGTTSQDLSWLAVLRCCPLRTTLEAQTCGVSRRKLLSKRCA